MIVANTQAPSLARHDPYEPVAERGRGTAFEELVAALLPDRDPVDRPRDRLEEEFPAIARPGTGTEPFEVRGLGGPLPSAEGQIDAAAAEIFNQRGFFGSATSCPRVPPLQLPAKADTVWVRPISDDLPPTETWTASFSLFPTLSRTEARLEVPEGGRLFTDCPFTIRHEPGVPSGSRRLPVDGIQGEALGERAETIATETAQADAEPAPSRSLGYRLSGTRSAVYVALVEIERGFRVIARVDALSEADRERLQDEIAALLARHGLAAHPQRITIFARCPSLQEDLK